MKALVNSRVLSLSLLLAAIIAGYLGFRYFYGISGDFPFSQELLLVAIGTVATVLVTALLLNQQTELELRKEGQVLLLDQKSAVYSSMLEHLGEVVEEGRLDGSRLSGLRVLNHKLAMVASSDVIRQFGDVLRRLDGAVADGEMRPDEKDAIMQSVAVLTFYMRRDLLGRIEGEVSAHVLRDIQANSAGLEEGSE